MTRKEAILILEIVDNEIDWSDPYIAPEVARKELKKLIDALKGGEPLTE